MIIKSVKRLSTGLKIVWASPTTNADGEPDFNTHTENLKNQPTRKIQQAFAKLKEYVGKLTEQAQVPIERTRVIGVTFKTGTAGELGVILHVQQKLNTNSRPWLYTTPMLYEGENGVFDEDFTRDLIRLRDATREYIKGASDQAQLELEDPKGKK